MTLTVTPSVGIFNGKRNTLRYSALIGLLISVGAAAQSQDITLTCGSYSLVVHSGSASVNGTPADKVEVSDTTLRIWMPHPMGCQGSGWIEGYIDHSSDDPGLGLTNGLYKSTTHSWTLPYKSYGDETDGYSGPDKDTRTDHTYYCGDDLFVVDRYSGKMAKNGATRQFPQGTSPDQFNLYDHEDRWGNSRSAASTDCARAQPLF